MRTWAGILVVFLAALSQAPKAAGGEPKTMNDGAYHPRGNRNIDKHWYGVFMADYAAQATAAGSSAVMAWMLDDNSHQGFAWGLWSDKKSGPKLRPWAYPWTLLCRYVPPGATVYRVTSPSREVRLLAAKTPNGGWTLCAVNRGTRAARVVIRVAGEERLRPKHLSVPVASSVKVGQRYLRRVRPH